MATLAKGSAFIFLMTFLVYTGKAQLNSGGHFGGGFGGAGFGGGGHAGGGSGGAGFGGGARGVGLGGSNFGGGGHADFGSGADAGDAFAVRKIQVVEPVPLGVNHPAIAAVPIHFDMADYNGPYDPLDPQGIAAAAHRQAKITQRKNADLVKSYVPPGLGEMVKKEAIKTLVNEGRRFAVAHPKETAELVGIAAKAKALVNTANRKLESVEKKEAKEEARGRD